MIRKQVEYNKVIKLRNEEKLSIREIVKRVNVSKGTISRWLNLNGPLKPNIKRLTPAYKEKMRIAAIKSNKNRVYKIKAFEDCSWSVQKKRLFSERGRKCEKCGWAEINKNSNICPVQIHHIDGNNKNNSKENLIILCPNCHSLTDSFMFYGKTHDKKSFKSHRTKIDLTKINVKHEIKKRNYNIAKTARELNISDTTLRRYIKIQSGLN